MSLGNWMVMRRNDSGRLLRTVILFIAAVLLIVFVGVRVHSILSAAAPH